jgi:uncharacterized repeat protein (TIGR03803 family)
MNCTRRAFFYLFSILIVLLAPLRGRAAEVVNLHSFNYFTDGEVPYSGLAEGPGGILYGTTFQGGSEGYGVVYDVTTNGAINTLYDFTNGVDGAFPQAGLVFANDGNFYGCTVEGGTNNTGVISK